MLDGVCTAGAPAAELGSVTCHSKTCCESGVVSSARAIVASYGHQVGTDVIKRRVQKHLAVVGREAPTFCCCVPRHLTANGRVVNVSTTTFLATITTPGTRSNLPHCAAPMQHFFRRSADLTIIVCVSNCRYCVRSFRFLLPYGIYLCLCNVFALTVYLFSSAFFVRLLILTHSVDCFALCLSCTSVPPGGGSPHDAIT